MPRWLLLPAAAALAGACASAPAPPARSSSPAASAALTCPVSVSVEEWSQNGDPPRQAPRFLGWIAGTLVYAYLDLETGIVAAHLYRPQTRRWRLATFSPVDATHLRGGLDRLSGRVRAHLVGNEQFVATEDRLLFVPLWRREGVTHAGAVLDPAAGTWRPIAAARAPRWNDKHYRFVAGGRWILMWRRPVYNEDMDAASWHMGDAARILFDPRTHEWHELPLPPVDVRREQSVLAVDDGFVVFWGGSRRNRWNQPDRMFDDGAVYDIQAGRWRLLPAGPSARSGATTFFHDGRLMLFGGTDVFAAAAKNVPRGERDYVVKDAYVLDVRAGRWTRTLTGWTAWTPRQPAMVPCGQCGPSVQVGHRLYFNNGLLFDGDTQAWTRVPAPPVRNPAPDTQADGFALDDRHVLFLVRGATGLVQPLVLDAQSLRWCAASFPPPVRELLARAHRTTAHERRLYVWRPFDRSRAELPSKCPPGAPCMARFESVVTPAKGVIVSFGR